MSGSIEVGQTWQRGADGGRVRVTSVDAEAVCFRGPDGSGVSSVVGFLRWYQHKPTIPLRIRVGVTADGTWLAMGSNAPARVETQAAQADLAIQEGLQEEVSAPVVAWHWITAEVPMPETEHGDVAGEVEQPCAGMPSDQKGSE